MGTNTEGQKKRDFSKMSVIQQIQLNAMLDTEKEKSLRLKPIDNYYRKKNEIAELWEMGEDNEIVIARTKNPFDKDGGDYIYEPWLNGKRSSSITFTYDRAVLFAISMKYQERDVTAGQYMGNMINMPQE